MSELDRLARKYETVLLKLAERERQLAEIEARYTPLVTENDELREKLEMSVLDDLRECARSWEPEVRLLGNVRACEIVELCDELAETRAKLEQSQQLHASCREMMGRMAGNGITTNTERAVLDAVDRTCEGRNGLPTDQAAWRPVAEAWRAKQLARRGEKP